MKTGNGKGLNILAVVGLVLGAVFGMLGAFISSPMPRMIFWGIDGSGLVMAASLLTLKYFRKGNDIVAGGFLVFVIGEGVILSGAATELSQAVATFAAGTALWATGLYLISIPREFVVWVRLLGLAAAILFTITAATIFLGHRLSPISRPLPILAYPFLVATFVGWIWTLWRDTSRVVSP